MKVKIFEKYCETMEQFEQRINDFLATVKVVSMKYETTGIGSEHSLTSTQNVLVVYEELASE